MASRDPVGESTQYEIGSVVNGHKWTGEKWKPLPPPLYRRSWFQLLVICIPLAALGLWMTIESGESLASVGQAIPGLLLAVVFLALAIAYVWQAVAAGEAAKRRGRSDGGFVVLALLLPIVAWIILLTMAPNPRDSVVHPLPEPRSSETDSHTPQDGGRRACPYCAEDIKVKAVVCRFCGRDVSPA